MKNIKQVILLGFILCSVFSCEENSDAPNKEALIEISDHLSAISFADKSIEAKIVTFTSSEDWVARSSADWIEVSPPSGIAGRGSITITAEENTTSDDRTGEIVISAGTAEKKISVTQNSEGRLTVSAEVFHAKTSGEMITITLTTNLEYVVKIPQNSQSWITQVQTKGLASYNLQFEIAPTNDYQNREGEIIIRDTENNLSETIKIFQAQKDAIIISRKNLSVSENGGEIEVVIGSNISYVVKIPDNSQNWITQTPVSKNLPEKTVHFEVSPNTLETVRECKITVLNTESGISDILVVQQNRKDAVIISQTYSEITNDGGEVEIELAPNINYSIDIPQKAQSWVSSVVTKSSSSNKIKLEVKPNDTNKSRSANITIKQDEKEQIFEVYQSEPEAVVVSETDINVDSNETLVNIVVKSDIDYQLTPPTETWLSLESQPEGASNRKLTFKVTENAGAAPRVAKIMIKSIKSGIPEEVHITQTGSSDAPDVNNSAQIVLKKSGDLLLELGELSVAGVNVDAISKLTISGASMIDQDFKALKTLISLEVIDILETTTLSIPTKSFYANYRIRQVVLPAGIVSIGAEAFNGTGITNIIIPKSLKNWSNAFAGCGHLTSVVLTQGLTAISAEAFSNCPILTNISLPEGLIAIGPQAFHGTALTSIRIPTTLKSWSKAFAGCSNLKDVVLPEELTTIGKEAFLFTGVTSITIPSSITSWDGAFSGNTTLKSVKLTEGLTTIGSSAFSQSGLTSVTIPKSITNWGGGNVTGYAFNDCADLVNVVLSEGLTTLGEMIFKGTKLTTVTIPKSMKNWDNAFYDCSSLENVILPEGLTTIGRRAFLGTRVASAKIPTTLTNWDFAFSGCSSLKSVELTEGLTTIGNSAFSGTGLTTVTIPASMKSWSSAFSACNTLESVVLTEGLTTIGDHAFGNTSLKSIIIPKSLKNWDSAFAGCTTLETVELTEGLTTIGALAFENSGLTSITIPSSITDWDHAFSDCSSLMSVVLSEGLTTIGIFAFSGTRLSTVTIPKSITNWKLGDYNNNNAFDNCSSLTSVVFTPGLTTIGGMAFSRTGLTTVTIPSSITDWNYAFAGCTSLTSVKLTEGLTNIGLMAFSDSGLLTVKIPSSIKIWTGNEFQGNGAFSDCISLASAELSEGLTTIGAKAFSQCPNLSDVTSKNPTPPTIGEDVFTLRYIKNIYVPVGKMDDYMSKWSTYKDIIKEIK